MTQNRMTPGAEPRDRTPHSLLDLTRALRVPHLSLPAETAVADAFAKALNTRQAVAVIAAKGDGKTTAARRQRREHEAADAARLRANPDAEPLQILTIPRLTEDGDRGAALTVLRAVSPQLANRLERQTAKKAAYIQAETARLLIKRRIALVIVDDAEAIRAAGMATVRALLTACENLIKDRDDAPAPVPAAAYAHPATAVPADARGKDEGRDGDGPPSTRPQADSARAADHRASGVASDRGPVCADDRHGGAGVGFVFLGAPKFAEMWHDAEDAGGRRAEALHVPSLTEQEVADAYVRIVPALAPRVAAPEGQRKWHRWVAQQITRGRPRAVRVYFNHALEYGRLMLEREFEAAMAEHRAMRFHGLADCPFDREVFVEAWACLQRDARAAHGTAGPEWLPTDLDDGGAGLTPWDDTAAQRQGAG